MAEEPLIYRQDLRVSAQLLQLASTTNYFLINHFAGRELLNPLSGVLPSFLAPYCLGRVGFGVVGIGVVGVVVVGVGISHNKRMEGEGRPSIELRTALLHITVDSAWLTRPLYGAVRNALYSVASIRVVISTIRFLLHIATRRKSSRNTAKSKGLRGIQSAQAFDFLLILKAISNQHQRIMAPNIPAPGTSIEKERAVEEQESVFAEKAQIQLSQMPEGEIADERRRAEAKIMYVSVSQACTLIHHSNLPPVGK